MYFTIYNIAYFFSINSFHLISSHIIESMMITSLSARINILCQNGRYKHSSDKIILEILLQNQFSFYFLQGML